MDLNHFQTMLEKASGYNRATSFQEFWKTVFDRDDIPIFSRSKLLKTKDIIDGRNILLDQYIDKIHEDVEFNNNFSLYDVIPCYDSGLLFSGKDSMILWDINNIDVDHKEYTVDLVEYSYLTDFDQNGFWGVVGISKITYSMITVPKIKDDNVDVFTSCLPTGSTMIEWELLNKLHTTYGVDLALAENPSKEKYEEEKQVYFRRISALFLGFMTITNYLLNKNKPKIKKQKSENSGKTVKILGNINDRPEDERRIRTIGNISFKSKKPPRKSSSPVVRRYMKTSWKRRSYIRHYKSGKVVRVRETTCSRNKDNNSPEVHTTLRIL